MRAWIDRSDDIDQGLNPLEGRGDGAAGSRNALYGLVKQCESMLLDLKELTRDPMAEILHDHARRRP
jgi:hypothetical protein